MTGSIGPGGSANINPTKKFPSMFEPVHGSAPDIAGQGHRQPAGGGPVGGADARPPGPAASAAALHGAVAKVLAEGKALTPDLGGTTRTTEVAAAVCAALR